MWWDLQPGVGQLGWGLWVGGYQMPRAGGRGAQFLVTAVQPGAGVPGRALSPQSLSVPFDNESPNDWPGQLNPSPGTVGAKVPDAAAASSHRCLQAHYPLTGEDG